MAGGDRIRPLTTSLDMSDSSGVSAPHHGHQWCVLVFNLLPFFGGQFAPLFHDAMAVALKAYASGSNGPKHLAQGLLVSEVDLSAGLLHGHLLAYCPGFNGVVCKVGLRPIKEGRISPSHD